MMEDSQYSIPVPACFRYTPLVNLPWSISTAPKLLAGADSAAMELRNKICDRYGVQHCILTGSARSAYYLFLKATQLRGEIIMPSIMHTPTAVLLANQGLKPVFCDVAGDFCVTLDKIAPLASPVTRAVFVTHLFGKAAPIDEIDEWAKARSLYVLSNMVHMPDSVSLNNQPLASYGSAAFLSFNMDKPLRGIYGGALLTNSDEIYEQASRIELQPVSTAHVWKLILRYLALYRYKSWVATPQYLYYSLKNDYYNSNDVEKTFNNFAADTYTHYIPKSMHPWQAAFAEKLMDRSPEMVKSRIEHARRAIQFLTGKMGISTPIADDRPHTFDYFPVILDKRISRYRTGVQLSRGGIEAKWRYYPLHLQTKFRDHRRGNMTNTEALWPHYLLLPLLDGGLEEVDKIAAIVADIVREELLSVE